MKLMKQGEQLRTLVKLVTCLKFEQTILEIVIVYTDRESEYTHELFVLWDTRSE